LNSSTSIKQKREEHQEAIQLELYRNLYRQSFFDFIQDAVKILEHSTDFDWNWHHQYIANLLQQEVVRINDKKRKTQDFNINVPPRTSKSLIVSVCLNAWTWGCINPYLNFLCISHSEGLTVELAAKTKDLIESDWYRTLFPHVIIRQDTQAKSNFKNTLGGQRVSTSMFSSITGFGANMIIIDDALDANNISDINLENTIRKYKETIYNRLNNPSIDLRVIIGQRIHENDLSGWIKANDRNNRYRHIVLPIELTNDIEPKELSKYYVDGCLWNSRFPSSSFADLTTSDYVFATQYLQRPAPLAGGIIKKDWFEIIDNDINNIQYHLFIDSAYTDKKRNDATAITVAGIKDNIIYVKKVYELFLEFPSLIKKIKEIVETDTNYNCKIYIEPKASGKSIAQQLRFETHYNVLEIPPPKDSKLTRVNSITAKLQSRRVKLIKGLWNESFLEQCSLFPNSKRDDQIDTLVMCVDQLLNQRGTISWYM
jgi:predicted phage terminase large subunit-like protein